MLDFIKSVAPAIITLIGGGLVLNWFFVGRANLAALIERICNVSATLCDDCSEYWSANYDETRSDQAQLEAKIKAGVLQISALVGLVVDKRKCGSSSLAKIVADLSDACTGGLFESTTRTADAGRFMKIAATTSKLSVELQRLKIWSPLDFIEVSGVTSSAQNLRSNHDIRII